MKCNNEMKFTKKNNKKYTQISLFNKIKWTVAAK